ncbi:Secretory immunoglobulin A-binding protein EsiB [Porphyridium purpureum]|uniref:Secretory immunoglobulin A-binding protein EsiB n=1 Tax=Porphyridium purpureum TaxID=35688 RepID=A0A5J4YQ63_PORPP|nr:Secretory immunoglobulin A-binding protein EsiB [Porphyridium purpureum]|eukprot:POR0980..scf296_7
MPCGICGAVDVDVRVLPCEHTYCVSCLLEVARLPDKGALPPTQSTPPTLKKPRKPALPHAVKGTEKRGFAPCNQGPFGNKHAGLPRPVSLVDKVSRKAEKAGIAGTDAGVTERTTELTEAQETAPGLTHTGDGDANGCCSNPVNGRRTPAVDKVVLLQDSSVPPVVQQPMSHDVDETQKAPAPSDFEPGGEPDAQPVLKRARHEGAPRENQEFESQNQNQNQTRAHADVQAWVDQAKKLIERREFKQAHEFLLRAAHSGDVFAQRVLGILYERGEGVSRNGQPNPHKAVKWYRTAADAGDPEAQCNLGVCFSKGAGVAQSMSEAVRWYQKAAAQDHEIALYNLGLCYEHGNGVPMNTTLAIHRFRKAAELADMSELGDGASEFYYGWCFERGMGVEKNEREMIHWYRKAAAKNHKDARKKLVALRGQSSVLQQRDVSLGAEMDSVAQYNIAIGYLKGIGRAKNIRKAVSWFKAAAEQGHEKALYNLGLCHESGDGVPESKKEAVKYFRRAAEVAEKCKEGDGESEFYYGWCFGDGTGVRKSKEAMIYWYCKAAAKNHGDAIERLTALGISWKERLER